MLSEPKGRKLSIENGNFKWKFSNKSACKKKGISCTMKNRDCTKICRTACEKGRAFCPRGRTMKYTMLRYPEGKVKAVTFSYDDGCREDIRLANTLDKYGLKGTFNICNEWIAKESGGKYITEEEIRENILNKGHEVAVHGEWHKAAGLLRPIESIQDVINCRKDLESRFDRIIRGMAYSDSGILCMANHTAYEKIKSFLQDLDILYSRTLGSDNNEFELPSDWYQWMPTAHHDNPQILEWAKEFVSMDVEGDYCSSRRPKLFYVWGHAFEFERNGNWQRLDDICEVLANKDDIWYATNMEIYEYVAAFDSLVYSADGKRIYNPTLVTIWLDYDGTQYVIKPGERITLD